MIHEEEISNEVLTAYLNKLDWDKLKVFGADFTIKTVLSCLRKKGVKFVKETERVKITVVPVTVWPEEDVITHSSYYVYEQFSGWKGEVIREFKNAHEMNLVQVKIWKEDGSIPLKTTILKQDLKYES